MILFFDIDGTLTTTISGEKFGKHPKDYRVIKGVEEAVVSLPDCLCIGISNQLGVDYGYKSLDHCIEEQQFKLSLLPWLSEILFCPDEGKTCHRVWGKNGENDGRFDYVLGVDFDGKFRKPDIGMFEVAGLIHNQYLKDSWFIGDRPEDRDAAANLSINFAWADQWRAGKIQILPGNSAII